MDYSEESPIALLPKDSSPATSATTVIQSTNPKQHFNKEQRAQQRESMFAQLQQTQILGIHRGLETYSPQIRKNLVISWELVKNKVKLKVSFSKLS